MKTRLNVLICGDTLVLAGLRASLAAYAALDVIALERPDAAAVCALHPDALIFDVGAIEPAALYAIAELLPGLLLVGVDAATSRVLLWSGQQEDPLSTGDLVTMIDRHSRRPAASEQAPGA